MDLLKEWRRRSTYTLNLNYHRSQTLTILLISVSQCAKPRGGKYHLQLEISLLGCEIVRERMESYMSHSLLISITEELS